MNRLVRSRLKPAAAAMPAAAGPGRPKAAGVAGGGRSGGLAGRGAAAAAGGGGIKRAGRGQGRARRRGHLGVRWVGVLGLMAGGWPRQLLHLGGQHIAHCHTL